MMEMTGESDTLHETIFFMVLFTIQVLASQNLYHGGGQINYERKQNDLNM